MHSFSKSTAKDNIEKTTTENREHHSVTLPESALLKEGITFLEEKEFKQAEVSFLRVLAKNTNNKYAYLGMALVSYHQAKANDFTTHTTSIIYYAKKALEIDPLFKTTIAFLGNCYQTIPHDTQFKNFAIQAEATSIVEEKTKNQAKLLVESSNKTPNKILDAMSDFDIKTFDDSFAATIDTMYEQNSNDIHNKVAADDSLIKSDTHYLKMLAMLEKVMPLYNDLQKYQTTDLIKSYMIRLESVQLNADLGNYREATKTLKELFSSLTMFFTAEKLKSQPEEFIFKPRNKPFAIPVNQDNQFGHFHPKKAAKKNQARKDKRKQQNEPTFDEQNKGFQMKK